MERFEMGGTRQNSTVSPVVEQFQPVSVAQ